MAVGARLELVPLQNKECKAILWNWSLLHSSHELLVAISQNPTLLMLQLITRQALIITNKKMYARIKTDITAISNITIIAGSGDNSPLYSIMPPNTMKRGTGMKITLIIIIDIGPM